jgi:hypothetical protein
MSEPDPILPPEPLLRFGCGGCGQELEAPPAYAGVTGPCPVCGTPVRAPDAAADAALRHPAQAPKAGLHLPPLSRETGGVAAPGLSDPSAAAPTAAGPSPALPRADLPLPRPRPLPTRDEEEAEAVADDRQKEFRLRFFDAALLLLFVGTLAMGGAALAFTQSKRGTPPAASPGLSGLVVERMQQLDQHRDQAVEEAKAAMQHWVTASDPAAMEDQCLPGDPLPAVPGWAEPGKGPLDFEFIQARRIPGTERFLTMFEVLADPPLVVPVEETPAGARLHGRAMVQQQRGTLAKFLASQGQPESVFYVLLRPAPAPMARELVTSRPDLGDFIHVAVEPAFPADGTAACLACLQPGSEAAAIFAKRAHDPGLRPAVVRLAWRQHRESGNFVELVSFEPNAWSRH